MFTLLLIHGDLPWLSISDYTPLIQGRTYSSWRYPVSRHSSCGHSIHWDRFGLSPLTVLSTWVEKWQEKTCKINIRNCFIVLGLYYMHATIYLIYILYMIYIRYMTINTDTNPKLNSAKTCVLFIHQLGVGKSANDWSSVQNSFPDLVSIDCKETLWTPCTPTGQKNLCWFGSCLQSTACIQ